MNYFLVSSGLLTAEHQRRINGAVWEFLWLIDHQVKPKKGEPDVGLVLNGELIRTTRIATVLGVSSKTTQRNLRRLEQEGYIRTEEVRGVGKKYYVQNPKRWQIQLATTDKSVQGPTPAPQSVQGSNTSALDESVLRSTQICPTPPPNLSSVIRKQDIKTSRQENPAPEQKPFSDAALDLFPSPMVVGDCGPCRSDADLCRPSRKWKPSPDPRHARVRDLIQRLHFEKFAVDIQWDGSEGTALNRLLKGNPSWSYEQLARMVENRFHSYGINGDRPRIWLPNLGKWTAGPIDQFKNVKASGNGSVGIATKREWVDL